MSSDGKICGERAILEFERRMMGNNTEEIFDNNTDNKLIINFGQQVALYLDPRLKQRIAVMDSDGWKEAKEHFKKEYTKFYTHMKLYDIKLKEEKQQQQQNLSNNTDNTNNLENNKDNVRSSGMKANEIASDK